MKILVIGNGFLAKSVIRRLESEGHELLIHSRTLDGEINLRQNVGDIFDFENFITVLTWKPQIIIFTAWITTPGIYRNDVSNYEYAKFTTNLAQHLVQTEVEQLIVLGSCAEYGHQIQPSTAGKTKVAPNSLYAEQKVAAFHSAHESLQESDVRLTWARIFFPYGKGQDKKRLIPYLVDSLKTGASIQVSDRSSIHDWITSRDIASAISWIISTELPTEVDIGTTLGYTNIEILKLLEELVGIQGNYIHEMDEFNGIPEMAVVGENSPLFESGWTPSDCLTSGLEWILNSRT